VANVGELPKLRRQLRLERLADLSPAGAEFEQDRTLHPIDLFAGRLSINVISVRFHHTPSQFKAPGIRASPTDRDAKAVPNAEGAV
jgi:hypothetical protein